MDSGSQNAIAIIEALRTATDDVHKFVYQVFRKTNAKGWTQHHNVSFYGEGISGSAENKVAYPRAWSIHHKMNFDKSSFSMISESRLRT